MDSSNFYVVGIGFSAGGLPILEQFFEHIPADAGASFIVLPHLLRTFKSQLKELLAKHTSMPIHLITDSMKIRPDEVYILPENQYVKIWDEHLYLLARPDATNINTAIDTFFFSLASEKREKAIGIILSGSGKDGTAGAEAIYKAGGKVLVQDPGTSAYKDMPIHAIKENHPCSVAPIEQLVQDLLQLLKKVKYPTDISGHT